MNRFSLVLAGLLSALLVSCNVIVEPGPSYVPDLNVTEASYNTSFSSPGGQPVICDNRVTQIVYRFRYEGELESWSSYLQGQTLGIVRGEKTFTPGSAGVSPYETSGYEVTYTLSPNTAPYATSPDDTSPNGVSPENASQDNATVAPHAIVVTPVPNPTRIGATRLYLVLRGAGGDAKPYQSRDIPVYINCN